MLISCVFDRCKKSNRELEDAIKKWGLKINVCKNKFLPESNRSIQVDGLPIEHVQTFNYLGSIVPNIHTNIEYHTSLTAKAFGILKQNGCYQVEENI